MFFDKVSKWIDESVIFNTTGQSAVSPAMLRQLRGFTAVDTPVGSRSVSASPQSQLLEQTEWTLVQRNQVYNKIDAIAGSPIAERIKNVIITDAFFDLTGSHVMTYQYVDPENPEKAEKLTKDIEDFVNRTNLVDILKDCIQQEGVDYGEFYLSTPTRPGQGVIEILDNLDGRDLLAIYKNTTLVGALKFGVDNRNAKSEGFLPARDISHFMLGYANKRIKINKKFAERYNIAEKVRVARPILAGVYDLILQYNALEKLQSALELIKATQGIYLGIGISPQQDHEKVAKQLQEFTNKFNRNRQNVIDNLETLNISTLLESMNKVEFVPFSVEEGTNSAKQIDVKFTENNLSDILNNIRKTIALDVGIPEDKLSITTSGVKGTKEDSIATNPSYSKLLSTIQQLIGKGFREVCYKHLKYKYMTEEGVSTLHIDKQKVEILFSTTTNLNDRLEDENMLLKAETVGRMLSVVESLASSSVLPVDVAGEYLVDYWKTQMHKDVHLREVIQLMSPEKQKQLQIMMMGGQVDDTLISSEVPTNNSDDEVDDLEDDGDEVEIEDNTPDEDEVKEPSKEQKTKKTSVNKKSDDISDALDKKEEDTDEEDNVKDEKKSNKKPRKRKNTKQKKSTDIRDIFH